jgi:rSAM/selenodomain-associated transferase 1
VLPGVRRAVESLMNKTPAEALLVIVAKAPIAGQVKTRLYSDLTPTAATDLYRCFLQDKTAEMGSLEGIDLAIAYTPEDSKRYFTEFSSNGLYLFPQNGKDLGERLNHIFMQKSAEGYGAIAIIDSDSPDLPKSIVQEAFEWLRSGRAEAVFGPCYDGGYYLVGLSEPRPELFRDVPWSTPTVLQKTLEIATKNNVKIKLLQRWNDLDTFEDLLTYYYKHKDAPPEGVWTGKKTFQYLACLENVSPERKQNGERH